MLVEIIIFTVLNGKKQNKEKKARHFKQNLTKKCFFFKVCTKMLVKGYCLLYCCQICQARKKKYLVVTLLVKLKFNFEYKNMARK